MRCSRAQGLVIAVAACSFAARGSAQEKRDGGADVAATGSFTSDSLRIHYETLGRGRPIVLVHGWGVDAKRNWGDTGWIGTLASFRRVVTIDCRGHGESEKPHEQARYGYAAMSRDVVALLDHLGIDRADFFGYSMGAFMGAHLLGHERKRFSSMVLAGIGDETEETKDASFIAEALRAKDLSKISNPLGLAYRLYVAEDPRNDLEALALAALQMWPEGHPLDLGGPDLAKVDIPVLIVNGGNDHYAASNEKLAAAVHGARAIVVPGADHLTLVESRRFKKDVVAFLKSN